MDTRQYRKHLYHNRAHPKPSKPDEIWVDRRDSFLTVYFSALPFLGVEYWLELKNILPPGIVFPLGYLLFWAFYYTYYKPDVLEEHLTEPRKWDLMGIPMVFLGLAIWFVKVTLVEISRVFFLNWFFQPRQKGSVKENFQGHPGFSPPGREFLRQKQRQAYQRAAYQQRPQQTGQRFHQSQPRQHRTIHALPYEVREALHILGLAERSSWAEIQHRYRELAKRYHPDLNPEVTGAGKKFMMYDAAYRKLESFRVRGSFGR